MTGNVIEYVSPLVANYLDNRAIHIFSPECFGLDIAATPTSLASAVYTANLITYVPLILGESLTVAQFWWENGATAAGNTDVGIYAFDGATKISSTGSTANSGTTTIQVVDVTDFTLQVNTRYWLALGCDSGTHTFARATNGSTAVVYDFIGLRQQTSGWSSGLPSTATLNAASVNYIPMFGFTASSTI